MFSQLQQLSNAMPQPAVAKVHAWPGSAINPAAGHPSARYVQQTDRSGTQGASRSLNNNSKANQSPTDFERTAYDAKKPANPRYAEKQQQSSARQHVKRAKDKKASGTQQPQQDNSKGCCYGCGAKLQIEVPLGPGYVPPEKYAVKAKHKQLNKVLCERCSSLCNGAMIPAVEDFTQKLQAKALLDSQAANETSLQLLGKSLITPDQLRTQLMEVAAKKAVVVLLVDLMDASGTLMARVRDMVGRNPIVLIGTKMDLLPAGTHPKGVADWLEDAAARKNLNVISCHLVSSHSGQGMSLATGKICRERKGRDVYVVGAANVGKSAFVRAMLKEMAKFEGGNFDPAALANGKYLPVESPMPGTTLGIIPLKAFASGGQLYDTPGVHLHHRVPHMLSPAELKLLHPRKRLQPVIPSTPLQLSATDQQEDEQQQTDKKGVGDASSLPGYDWTGDYDQKPNKSKKQGPKLPKRVTGSYNWSDLVRLDILDAPPSTAMAFYGPTSMQVTAMPLSTAPPPTATQPVTNPNSPTTPQATPTSSSADSRQGNEDKVTEKLQISEQQPMASAALKPNGRILSCSDSVAARGGLIPHLLTVKVDGLRGPLADIAVSGVPGWVAVWAPGGKRDIKIRAWLPKGVEVFLRPPLPVDSPFKAVAEEVEEEHVDLDVSDVQFLASEYEGGGAKSSINDASWWEAAYQELEAFDDTIPVDEDGEGIIEGKHAVAGKDSDQDVEEQKADKPKRRIGLLGGRHRSSGRDDGERVIMQASVEDILKRPRLDDVALWDIEEDEEEAGNGDIQETKMDSISQKKRQPRARKLAELDIDTEDEEESVDELQSTVRRGRLAPARTSRIGYGGRAGGLRGRRAASRVPEDVSDQE